MKSAKAKLTALLGTTALLATNYGPAIANERQVKFYCGEHLGSPTTLVKTGNGDKPFIRWTSDRFDNSGWNATKRCQAVSARLEEAGNQNQLVYFTTGLHNGLPVICGTTSKGGSCQSMLYTLKPGQNPVETLKRLAGVRAGQAGPINETSERIYVSVDEMVERASQD